MTDETPLPPIHGNTGRPPANKKRKHGTQKSRLNQKPWNRPREGPLYLCESGRNILRELRNGGKVSR